MHPVVVVVLVVLPVVQQLIGASVAFHIVCRVCTLQACAPLGVTSLLIINY